MHLGYLLDLKLQTSLTQTQEPHQLCRVCRRHVGFEAQHPDQRLVALARIVNGTCPCCGQSAPAKPDRNYRARARRWVARRQRDATQNARGTS